MPLIKCARAGCGREIMVHILPEAGQREKWESQKAKTYCSATCTMLDSGEIDKEEKP